MLSSLNAPVDFLLVDKLVASCVTAINYSDPIWAIYSEFLDNLMKMSNKSFRYKYLILIGNYILLWSEVGSDTRLASLGLICVYTDRQTADGHS